MKKLILILTFLPFLNINAQSDTIYYENRNIREISSIENDSRLMKQYYESGQLKSIKKLNKEGQRIGKSVHYYKNGQILYNWNHNKKGKRNGQWFEYNEDGSIQSVENYTNGLKTGLWKYYWENYLQSTEEYNEKGYLIKDIHYRENGIALSIYSYDSEGKIISKEYFDEKGKILDLTVKTIIESSCN